MKQQPLKQRPNRSGNELLKYAGLAGQLFIAIGLAVFAGYNIDKWLQPPVPLLVWVLPFVVLSMMIYKLIKETSKGNKKNEGT
jgi:hypothetical protein